MSLLVCGGWVSLPNLTPQQLLDVATELMSVAPDAELVKNPVGNLAVVRGGEYLGYVDLRYGTLVMSAEPAPLG